MSLVKWHLRIISLVFAAILAVVTIMNSSVTIKKIRTKVSQWLANEWHSFSLHVWRHRQLRLVRRWFRGPFLVVLRWWILWASLVLAAALYLLGRHLAALTGEEFHLNLIVEGIGLFVALAIAWLLIERHSQGQARRTRIGVHKRIRILRNYASLPIIDLTTSLFDIPRLGSHDADKGPLYLRDNYRCVRRILGVPDSGHSLPVQALNNPKLANEGIRRRNSREWIFNSFVRLSKMCDETVRLFGPGLVEYPELLASLERVQSGVQYEQQCWARFREDEDLLPPEALSNLMTLAVNALGLVATITRILKDWKDMPAEEDMELRGAFMPWPARRRTAP